MTPPRFLDVTMRKEPLSGKTNTGVQAPKANPLTNKSVWDIPQAYYDKGKADIAKTGKPDTDIITPKEVEKAHNDLLAMKKAMGVTCTETKNDKEMGLTVHSCSDKSRVDYTSENKNGYTSNRLFYTDDTEKSKAVTDNLSFKGPDGKIIKNPEEMKTNVLYDVIEGDKTVQNSDVFTMDSSETSEEGYKRQFDNLNISRNQQKYNPSGGATGNADTQSYMTHSTTSKDTEIVFANHYLWDKENHVTGLHKDYSRTEHN